MVRKRNLLILLKDHTGTGSGCVLRGTQPLLVLSSVIRGQVVAEGINSKLGAIPQV